METVFISYYYIANIGRLRAVLNNFESRQPFYFSRVKLVNSGKFATWHNWGMLRDRREKYKWIIPLTSFNKYIGKKNRRRKKLQAKVHIHEMFLGDTTNTIVLK